jgi:hypothetical protein
MTGRYDLRDTGVPVDSDYTHEVEVWDGNTLIACVATPNGETTAWLSEQLNKLARVQDAAKRNLRKSSHPGRPKKAVGV